MIDIYIRYFKQGNNTINNWTKIESIPASNPSQLHFVTPKVKNEMGKSETMDFTVEPNSAYWNSFIPYKTFLRVVLDGYNIFYGRVLTITTTMLGSRSVQCEGPLSFLIDSYYPASKEGSRSKISAYTYLDKLLDNHNYYVAAWNYSHQNWSDPRGVYIGEVPGNYSNSISEDQKVVTEDQKYGVSSWTESKSAVEELRSYFGGYMRTRYNESDGYVYLDWFNNYFYKSNTPEEIEVTKNLIDASSTSEVNNVFTAIIPIGKNETYIDGYSTDGYLGTVTCNGKWLSAPMVYDYYGEEELRGVYRRPIDFRDGITKYGWIYKTVSFPNASTKKELFEQACRWFKNNYQPYVENYTIKALDMRIIGETGRPLLCGDIVRFDYSVDPVADEQSTKKALYTIISAEYDLYNPENNQYRIGIPANTLTKLYSVSGSGNSATGSGGYSNQDDTKPTVTGTYSDWIGDLYGFLSTSEVPGYPGRTYVETDAFGMVMRMYNPLTDTWETFTEQTYDTIRSKNLVSWIIQNDKANGTNWKSRLFGNSRDETSAWTDYTKEYLSTHNAPDGKPIYDTSDNTMWNDNAKMRVPVSGEYTPALMESFGLIKYVNDTYKEDFTNVEVKREIVPGENKVDPETGKTITVSDFFKTVWNGLTGKWETFKDGWMEMIDGVAKLFDKDGNEIDLGVGDTTISSLQTEWVNHDNRIGQVVTKDGKIEVGKIVLAINDDETVDAIIHADHVKATGTGGAMFGIVTAEGTENETLSAGLIVQKIQGDTGEQSTLAQLIGDKIEITGKQMVSITAQDAVKLGLVTTGKNGDSDLTAGLIVTTLQNGSSNGNKQTLATLIADYLELKGTQITIDATDAARFGLVTTGVEGSTTELTAGLIVQKLEGDDGEQSTLAELIGDKVSITAKQVADFGVAAQNEAGKKVTAKFIADTLNGGTATIDAKNLNLTNTEIINLINDTGEVTINAAKVNLSGYLTAEQIRSGYIAAGTINAKYISDEIAKIDNVSMKQATVTGTLTIGETVIRGDTAADCIYNLKVVADGNSAYHLEAITFGDASWHTLANSSFNKAATIKGTWSSGTYTVTPTAGYVNELSTSVTVVQGQGHWGDTGQGESANTYYGKVQYVIDGSEVYQDTGRTFTIDAASRYNAGWGDSYNAIGISHQDATLANGGSITISPTAKQTPSGSSQSVTGKSVTISSPTYSLDPSSNPTALAPGGSKVVKLMSQKGSETPTEVAKITVSARGLQSGDITFTSGSFGAITATGGYTNVGTATPAASDTYWGFRISDLKNFYVKVSACTDRYETGWTDCYDTIELSTGTSPITLDPGDYQEVWAKAKARSGDTVKSFVAGVGITARGLQASDITMGAFTKVSSTTGYSFLGTATPETSDTYWGFKVSGLKDYYVKVNAYSDRYNAGWSDSFAEISLSEETQALAHGGSVTVYPVAKATPSTSAANITRKGITITAASLSASDITMSAFTKVSSTTGYSFLGTATPATSDTYWHFKVSGLKDYYVKVNAYTIPAQTISISGWSTATANDGISEIGTCALGSNTSGYWKFTVNNTNTYRVKATATQGNYNDGYDDGAKTCYIGDSNYTKLTGTKNLDFGESYTVWPYAKLHDGSYTWGSSVTFVGATPSPWIGRDAAGTEVTQDINLGFGESVDLYAAVTRGSGTIYWGPKRTITSPESTDVIISTRTRATRTGSNPGYTSLGSISGSLISSGQYVYFQLYVNGQTKSFQINFT